MPPAPTGVADYAKALLEILSPHCDLRLNSTAADVCVYHLGNNQLHRETYIQCLEKPGIVVLHDAVLNHFFLNWLERDEYVREFAYNYGEYNRALAADLWDCRSTSAADPCYFEWPMLRRVASASRALVVHNPAAARMVRRHVPDARIFQIPHLARRFTEPSPEAVSRWRNEHGIGPEQFLFGVFGHLRETKRLHSVVRAFQSVGASGAALLVAGDFVSAAYEHAVAPALNGAGVARVPFLPDAEFNLAVSAVDACINLRYPSAGETSGITVRLMNAGRPVIATSGDEIADIPNGVLLRVDPGVPETKMLAEYMSWLISSRDAAGRIGLAARDYIRSEHSETCVAGRYLEVLRCCA